MAKEDLAMDIATAERVTAFWMQVEIGKENECWAWKGYEEKGYGLFFFGGKMRGAHEMSLTFTTGEVRAPHLDTCHSCNNPICVNPKHLRFDSRASNVADMYRSGRARNGAKLSPQIASEIRARLSAGAKQKDLAGQYGVSASLISMIKSNRKWAA